jgi:hypothetical protein
MRQISRSILMVAAAILLAACSFIELTKEGEKVRLVETGEIMGCKYLGQVTASVADRVGIVGRKEESVQENVNVLARNAAADMGGDTAKPADNLKEGKQKFDVYRCQSK